MKYLVLLTALVGLPAHGAPEATTMTDTRLDQAITITEKGDRLAEVLKRLSKETEVQLMAEKPMSDTRISVRYDGTLCNFMHALKCFFAVDKEKDAWWCPSLAGQYRLQRDKDAIEALDALRKERQAELGYQMNAAIRDQNPWAKGLEHLTQQQRMHLYAGGEVTARADELGGKEFLEAKLGPNLPDWGESVAVSFFMLGRSPLNRLFCWRLREEGPDGPIQESETSVGVWQVCPGLSPQAQQIAWRQRFDDPAPRDAQDVSLREAPLPVSNRFQGITRAALLLRIAEKAKVNLIADDAGQVMDETAQPVRGTVAALLDAACAFAMGPPGQPEGCHASFWRKAGDCYLVRSLAWPEEEG